MTTTTRLGDLVSILGGGTPSRNRPDYYNGDIPWVTVKDLKDELTLSSSQERITKLGLENSASRLVPAGNVIVATRMAVGKVVRTLADVAINQDLKAVVCGRRIDSRFLLFFLRSKASLLEAKANGSTVKGILIEDLQELQITLPPLPAQQQIATQLEEADRLCRTRRFALELPGTSLPATFLELFGDPIENSHGFPVEPLEDLIQSTRPISYGILMPGPDVPTGVPYIRVTDIQDGQVVTALIRRTTREIDQAYKRSKLKAGDLLLSIRGHVGRMAIVPACLDGANITQDTARLATVETLESGYRSRPRAATNPRARLPFSSAARTWLANRPEASA